MNIVTKEEAKQLLLDHRASKKGTFFSAQFVKADGTYRFMTARFSVRQWQTSEGVKKLSGTGSQWKITQQAVQVWDAAKQSYRSIPTERLVRLKLNKKEYTVI